VKTITFRQLKHQWRIYLLLLPTVALVATFAYYPAISAFQHAFYRWNGDDIAVWVGIENFKEALRDPQLGKAFGIVLIFIASNFVKMIPSIITAVVIHRMISDKSRYLYRVLFVIPMIIPAIVWLLIWKFFYDPNVGILNKVLNATGLMSLLQWFDVNLPAFSNAVAPTRDAIAGTMFGGVFGMLVTGAILLSLMNGWRSFKHGWLWWILLAPVSIGLMGWLRFAGVFAGAMALATALEHVGRDEFEEDRASWRWARMVLYGWLAWIIYSALVAMQDGKMLASAILLVATVAGYRYSGIARSKEYIKRLGILLLAVSAVLIVTTLIWTKQTDSFATGSPAWLGDSNLALPAMVFWGFPWVGVVSVLLYLAGLGNIDQSVYEAADIDGCSWIRKFFNIELPLITTQVRLNLVLMIINTLKGWGLVYIIWGDSGGPGGAVMLPGLYMFRNAFTDMRAGYACAIGLLLFALIVVLTLLNNKYVRVEK
jgi:ABC-type sugar transport system permease subunit